MPGPRSGGADAAGPADRKATRGRGSGGTARRYAAGIAIEIAVTLLLMLVGLVIAFAGFLLWR